MTTVYLCRHSTSFKEHRGIENITIDYLTWNKMSPLSVEGEKKAYKLSKKLKRIDVVWSSDYVRTMSTAKYISQQNKIKVNIDERLGERIQGIIPKNLNFEEYTNNQLISKFSNINEPFKYSNTLEGELFKAPFKRIEYLKTDKKLVIIQIISQKMMH